MKDMGSSSLYVKTSSGISLIKKSRPVGDVVSKMLQVRQRTFLTYYQALHLIFSQNLDAQRFGYLVIVLESTTTGRHDAQVFGCCAIVVFVIGLQLAHELDARIYPVRFKFEEVQSATDRIVARFAREVYQLCE
jgi:hypothetical protein